MCAHLILIPHDELERIIADVQDSYQAEHENLMQSCQHAYPNTEIPVVVVSPNRRLEIKSLEWGFVVSWQKKVIFNAKMETALSSRPGLWSDSIQNYRCIVPSFGFYEPHHHNSHSCPATGKTIRDQYYFSLPDSAIVWMAGIYKENQVSIMTTFPNPWMIDIHPRMPVVLLPDELDTWLQGEYSSLMDRSKIKLESRKVA